MNFKDKHTKNNVTYLTEKTTIFSTLYIDVRKKENRVLTSNQISKLPYLETNEWKLRSKSTERFTTYLKQKRAPQQVLDIGCGNGWFTNTMAQISNKNEIIGLDVNHLELEQASAIFKSNNLNFMYGDIFNLETLFNNKFDIITLNASIQYFPDLTTLFNLLKTFLKTNGEIHIIDSPFYEKKELPAAKKRSIEYYTNLEYPDMASNYFHHSIEKMKEFDILYSYRNLILRKILNNRDSPFTWFRYTKIN